MVDIQSATAEIRRGKNQEEERWKPQGKNIMSASATQGGHNKCRKKTDQEQANTGSYEKAVKMDAGNFLNSHFQSFLTASYHNITKITAKGTFRGSRGIVVPKPWPNTLMIENFKKLYKHNLADKPTAPKRKILLATLQGWQVSAISGLNRGLNSTGLNRPVSAPFLPKHNKCSSILDKSTNFFAEQTQMRHHLLSIQPGLT